MTSLPRAPRSLLFARAPCPLLLASSVQSSRPAGHLKYDQHIALRHFAGREFPIEQRHDRAGVELAVAGCLQNFYLVGRSRLLIHDQTIDTLALISEMLGFHRIFRIRRAYRIFLKLIVDRYDFGSVNRSDKPDRYEQQQNPEARFHSTRRIERSWSVGLASTLKFDR